MKQLRRQSAPTNFEEWHDGIPDSAEGGCREFEVPFTEADVVDALREAESMSGLAMALEVAEEWNTAAVREVLLERARSAENGTVRVSMAALLYFHCGKSAEAFDWAHRPFFLQFGDEQEEVRRRAWEVLRAAWEVKEGKKGSNQ